MAFSKKRGIIWLSIVLMVLLLGTAVHELWIRMALRDRPWQLEAYLDNLSARCMTDAAAYVFARELRALASQIDEAKHCLNNESEAWAVRRDYTACYQKLLHSSLAALQIRRAQEQRARDQDARLHISLKNIESELSGDAQIHKAGAKFGIRNLAQSRARTMVETARNLIALGQTDSAVIATMRARAAWVESENSISEELARFYDPEHRAQWDKTAQDLVRWTGQTGRAAILVDKLEHCCLLLSDGRIERTYMVNLGRNWFRLKAQEHDASTPEGEYRIKRKFRSGNFGWALLLDYPNAADRQRFNSMKKTGAISARARIGGNIEIHGGGRRNLDWTDGCVSLENPEMADLYGRAYAGMPVTIVGTSSLGATKKD
jgi:hypothetical protein